MLAEVLGGRARCRRARAARSSGTRSGGSSRSRSTPSSSGGRAAGRRRGGPRTATASGALHDAAELARRLPAAMVFAASTGGISHAKEEDTADADLVAAIEAFGRLAASHDLSSADESGRRRGAGNRRDPRGRSLPLLMSEAWDRIEGLPLRVESYELTAHDREYGSFTRPSTVIHLHGDDQEGVGEDVVYDVLDHIAHRDAGPDPRLHRRRDAGRVLRADRPARSVRDDCRARHAGIAALPALGLRERGARSGAPAGPACRCTRHSDGTRSRCSSSARPG